MRQKFLPVSTATRIQPGKAYFASYHSSYPLSIGLQQIIHAQSSEFVHHHSTPYTFHQLQHMLDKFVHKLCITEWTISSLISLQNIFLWTIGASLRETQSNL